MRLRGYGQVLGLRENTGVEVVGRSAALAARKLGEADDLTIDQEEDVALGLADERSRLPRIATANDEAAVCGGVCLGHVGLSLVSTMR
jgi:hypothetical protein